MDFSTPTVSPLRQRMVEDMRMRKFEPKTQSGYLRAVRKLAAFLKVSLDTATAEELRRFQMHLVDEGASPITLNATISGLKFFFDVTLSRSELMARMQPVSVPRTLPVVLSREEVSRLIAAAWNLKHQTALAVAYGIGLRASFSLLANGARKTNLALARELLHVLPTQGPQVTSETGTAEIPAASPPAFICRHCGHAMSILQTLMLGESIRAPPGPACTP